jgi:hypothetical protein
MAQLFNRFQLANELSLLITEAKEFLILISPYFKLNQVLINALNSHKQKKNFELVIVYGKNEEDKRKSLCDDDLDFFKTFPNVEIRYHKRLHAKIYLNEKKCLITSLNLHDYSLNENIEVGILTKSRTLDGLRDFARSVSKGLVSNSLDMQAASFAEYIVEKSTIEFQKKVTVKKHYFGLFKKTGESEIILEKSRTGFCIRTGDVIPLNPKHPYCATAFKSWQVYNNAIYKEKFCHSCGKDYPTSMAKPDCPECYRKK